MSSFTTFSSADEFSPLQPIFPNLSPSEEMSVLSARISELNRAKTMEPSVASSEVFGQDGYGMNDDEFSLDEEEDEQQQGDRKTPTKDVLEDHLKAILERIGEIEKQQQHQTKEESNSKMSISTNSINCGDDLTPTENGEVNGNAISLDNNGQFDGKNSESITDQQQLKEFREKFAKMEMELNMAKLELENKALEQKLKHQELMVEQKTLKKKGTKIEQEKEKNAILPNLSPSEEMSVLIARIAELNRAKTIEPSVASSELFGQDGYVLEDHLKVILERIGELEKQQQQQTKAAEERFLQSQNNQKKILKRIFSELEKQTRKKALFRKNCWNSFACHKDIEIIGDKSLIVHHKGNLSGSRCSVVAKYPIVLNKYLSDFFYYEISVQKKRTFCVSFGFADKQQTELDGIILCEKGTYTYESDSDIWINGKRNGTNAEYSYGVGDTVGIGVHFASRQMIFTKNGLLLDTADFLFDPSFADGSFYPFVTLFGSGDKIEANFGPNFKFDLETL